MLMAILPRKAESVWLLSVSDLHRLFDLNDNAILTDEILLVHLDSKDYHI